MRATMRAALWYLVLIIYYYQLYNKGSTELIICKNDYDDHDN